MYHLFGAGLRPRRLRTTCSARVSDPAVCATEGLRIAAAQAPTAIDSPDPCGIDACHTTIVKCPSRKGDPVAIVLNGSNAPGVKDVSRREKQRAIAVGKPTSRKRRGKGRGGLGRVMAIVALAAVGLAMTRGMMPMYLGAFGPLVAILLWLFYTGVIERHRLEGFHYATAVVTVLASGFLARQIALDYFRPLGPLVAGSHWAALVEHLIGAALSLMLGLAAGIAVRRLEQAKGWNLAPFFRGAIVGSFVASRSCSPPSTKIR